MAAGQYNFTIEQGTTVDFEVQYSDSGSNGIDLSAYDHARMQIRQSHESDVIIYLSSSNSGFSHGYVQNPTNNGDHTGLSLLGSVAAGQNKPMSSGSIGIYVSAHNTANFNFDKAQYDLELVSGSGDYPIVHRILQGKIKLSKEITKG